MDKKTRKRIERLKDKLANRQKGLRGAKEQADEAGELERLKAEIAAIEAELRRLQEP